MKRVVVLGAGITGLAAAFFLKKQGLDVTLIEKSDRVGGWIRSVHAQGFLFERGPRAFRSSGKGRVTLALIRELGLENELLEASEAAKKRYLFIDGKLQRLSPWLLLRLGLLPALRRDFFAKKGPLADETIASFSTRRLGRSLTEKLIDPVALGIYGGKIEELSAEACFPLLVQWEREHGSLLRGFLRHKKERASLFSFKEGMETLPSTLAKQLKIYRNTPVLKISERGVETTEGFFSADHIFSALPARALSVLLPEKREILEKIPALSLTTISFGFSKRLLNNKGFGYLVPTCMGEKILGVTFDSEVFNREGTTLCVMMRGEGDFLTAREAIERHLGIHAQPDAVDIHTAENAIPQYLPGHNERLTRLDLTYLTCIGNSFYGAGVNDCIASAEQAAKQIALR